MMFRNRTRIPTLGGSTKYIANKCVDRYIRGKGFFLGLLHITKGLSCVAIPIPWSTCGWEFIGESLPDDDMRMVEIPDAMRYAENIPMLGGFVWFCEVARAGGKSCIRSYFIVITDDHNQILVCWRKDIVDQK